MASENNKKCFPLVEKSLLLTKRLWTLGSPIQHRIHNIISPGNFVTICAVKLVNRAYHMLNKHVNISDNNDPNDNPGG